MKDLDVSSAKFETELRGHGWILCLGARSSTLGPLCA